MSYLILFDEEKNVVEIQYEGVNAALLAEINIRLTNLENEFEESQGENNTAQDNLEDDIDDLNTLVDALSSALTAEVQARETGDITVATNAANALFQVNEDLSLAIEQEAEIRAQAILEEAEARGAAIAESEAIIMTEVAILATSVEGMATRLGAAEASIIEVSDALVTETQARVAQYSALQADYGDTNAAILEETVARADADEALAYQISILEVSVGDNTAAIMAEQSARIAADGSIEAKYSVKVDINGYVAGFGLIATENDGVPTSSFIILADHFAVVTPGNTPTVPFRIDNGVVHMQNVRVDWAYIDNAQIGEAQIGDLEVTTGKIDDLAVTTGKIDHLAVTTGKIGDLQVDTIKIAGSAVSVPASAVLPGVLYSYNYGGGSWVYVTEVTVANTSTVPMAVTGMLAAIMSWNPIAGNTINWFFMVSDSPNPADPSLKILWGYTRLESASFQFQGEIPAGTTKTYYVFWSINGANTSSPSNYAQLNDCALTVLGTKR